MAGAVPGVEASGGLIKFLNRLITELKAKRAMSRGPGMTQGHPSGCPHQALYGSCPCSHQRHSAVSRLPQVRLCCPSAGLHAAPSPFSHVSAGDEAGAGRPGTDSPSPRLAAPALAGCGPPLLYRGGQGPSGLRQLPLLTSFWHVVPQHTRSSFRL